MPLWAKRIPGIFPSLMLAALLGGCVYAPDYVIDEFRWEEAGTPAEQERNDDERPE